MTTTERVLLYRTPANVTLGALIKGQAGWVSGGTPGGTTTLLVDEVGYFDPPGIMGRFSRVECVNDSFGNNGGGLGLEAANIGIAPAMMFPPYAPPSGEGRVWRARDCIWTRIIQADTTFPQTSRMFWGFHRFVDLEKEDTGESWVGFYAKALGTTFGNWFMKVSNDAKVLAYDQDSGISADANLAGLRIDLDSKEGEIRFYIGEEEVGSYSPQAGDLGGTDTDTYKLGITFNVGYETGQSTNAIGELMRSVMSYYNAFITEVSEDVT